MLDRWEWKYSRPYSCDPDPTGKIYPDCPHGHPSTSLHLSFWLSLLSVGDHYSVSWLSVAACGLLTCWKHANCFLLPILYSTNLIKLCKYYCLQNLLEDKGLCFSKGKKKTHSWQIDAILQFVAALSVCSSKPSRWSDRCSQLSYSWWPWPPPLGNTFQNLARESLRRFPEVCVKYLHIWGRMNEI